MNMVVEYFIQAPDWQRGLMLFVVYGLHFWLMVVLMMMFLKGKVAAIEVQIFRKADDDRIRALVEEHFLLMQIHERVWQNGLRDQDSAPRHEKHR